MTKNPKKKLLLIDTFNFLHRAYHALPKTFTDSEGNPTNAIFGVTSMFINIFDTIAPDYAVAALDSKEPTFRVEDFTGYKAHRKPMENDLSVQIDGVLDVIDAFGLKKITVNGYEADDVIGTLVSQLKDDVEIIVASNDRDLWQLVDEDVVFLLPQSKAKGVSEWLGKKEIESRLEFDPKLLIDYKGLRGDPSDNIPGVMGVGDKTAKKLLSEFGSIEGIYKNIDDVKPESLRNKLLNSYETALMSKKLATIITDVPMTVGLDECHYKEVNKVVVKRVLEKYNFKSLIKRLGFDDDSERKNDKRGNAPSVDENQISLF